MNVISKTLNNKFKIILAKDNSNPLVCLQLYVRIGSVWERREEAGYSHFTEHLVFKSTEKFPQNSIMERVTYLGGSINAYTEYDTTCFYITLPSKFVLEGIEILTELTRHANYSKQEFESEKKVVIEELKQFKNDPEEYFLEQIAKNYFKKNPYRFPIIGNKESLINATYLRLKRFYKKYYSSNNCFLIASGDFEESKLMNAVNSHFGNWKPNKIEKIKKVAEDYPEKPKIISIEKNISNDILAFVLPDLAETNPDSYPLSLAMKAFAIGKNSHVYTRLFDNEKLIDSIKVHSLSGINSGASIILVMPKKNADLTKICKIILEELEQFYRFGINEIELKDHKKELIFFYRYAFEYVESLAASLGCEEILTGYENLFKYPDIIESINNSKLNQIISKYFKKDHLYIFHYGNRKFDKTEIKKRLNLVDKKISKITQKKEFYETRLDNGMKVLLKQVYGKPTIGISLSYEVSQLNELKKNRGLNLLTSGLMLYGNEKRNYQQFLNYCTSNGINFGITPQSETTSIKLKCFKEMLPMSLELLSEVTLTPVFPADFFHNLQQIYSSNLDRVKDYPNHYAAKLWKEMIFGKQSNIIDRTGSKTSIKKISLKQIRNWYKNFYHPENMSLSIVGDFNFEEVLRSFENLFVSNIKKGKISIQKPIIESSKNKKKRTFKKMDQSVINIGGFGCTAMETPKNTAFHVLAQIIGGDTNSILFNELREKRGLAYFVEFSFHSIRSLGFWVASAIVDKKRESEAVNMIHTVLHDIKKNGIQTRDLEKTKNYIRGQRLMEEESMLNQAHTLSVLESIGFGYEYYLKWEERLNKVNLKALQKIAEEYFNESEYFIHVLS